MMNWLTQHSDTIGILLTIVGGWFGLKKVEQNKTDLKNLVIGKINDEYQRIIHDPSTWDRAKEMLLEVAWRELATWKIDRTNNAWRLVVETVVGELVSRVQEELARRNFQKKWDELFARISGIDVDKLFSPEKTPIPKG